MNLNFGFAKVQLDRGNACGAIGTLERVLLEDAVFTGSAYDVRHRYPNGLTRNEMF